MKTDGRLRAYALTLAALAFSAQGCRSEQAGGGAEVRGVVVVNSPAAGEVRRVLVREGMAVNEGEAVAEIALPAEAPTVSQANREDPQRRAAAAFTATQAEVEAAREEVVRYQVEVQRLTPLVAAGQASQGELDGARALYERAQQRLRQAQDAAQRAQGGLDVARGRAQTTAPAAPPPERLVVARAPASGTVSAVSARTGQRVSAGQPLATLRAQ